MRPRTLLFAQLAVLLALYPYVRFGISHDYLWYVLWFSAIAHFLGGVWAALFAVWAQSVLGFPRNLTGTVAAAFVIGILWELFEFYTNNYIVGYPFDRIDTISDLFLDLLGGVLVIIYFFKIIMPIRPNEVQSR